MAVLSAVGTPPIFLRYRLKTIRNARGELFDALAKGKLAAFGDRRTGNGLEPIPAVEWSRLRPPFENGSDRAGPYHDVVLARAEVLRHWPSPSAAVEDEPDHLEAGSRAGACAATEPAEITEPAAADVQQETELSIAIGRSGSLPAEISEWYRDAWVPECRNAGLIPTRDDELKATRRRFGSTPLRGQRELVRRARREHGPEEWHKTGPKGLDRKNNDNHGLVDSVIERACQFRQPE